MSDDVIEAATFDLVDGRSERELVEGADHPSAITRASPAVLLRRLPCDENGAWSADVEGPGRHEDARALGRVIDGHRVAMDASAPKGSAG